jgi:hypothetical protein
MLGRLHMPYHAEIACVLVRRHNNCTHQVKTICCLLQVIDNRVHTLSSTIASSATLVERTGRSKEGHR